MSNFDILKHIGRKKIFSAYEPSGDIYKDKKIAIKMLQETYSMHQENVSDMRTIKKFFDNNPNYFDKEKQMRSDIDNKISVPDVYRIVRDLNGHICGDGVVFSDITGTKSEQIENFNGFLRECSFDSIYLKANQNASLYGVGYYYVDKSDDGEIITPFVIESENLDPKNTYCVYNNDIIPKKIWAVWFKDIKKLGETSKRVIYVWSKYAMYRFEGDIANLNGDSKKGFEPYPLVSNIIPIVEVQRNENRIGDSELALGLIQAKALLFSNRLDDVQQIVDYVYLLTNLSLGVEEEAEVNGETLTDEEKFKRKAEKIKKIVSSRVIELTTINPTIPPKVDILKNPLNQTEIQTFADYIDGLINIVVALPDRNSSASNSDTGVANDYKLGFRSLESYSDTVTTFIKKSLRELLQVIISLVKNDSVYNMLIKDLLAKDIEIKPQRNKIFSVTESANAYSTLRKAGLNDEDAIKLTGVSQSIPETLKKNKNEQLEKETKEKQGIITK